MTWSTHVRMLAREKRTELGIGDLEPVGSSVLCLALEKLSGISPLNLPNGDPLLGGAIGVLDADMGAIWLDSSLSPAVRNATCAHEYGHYFLHRSGLHCIADDLAESIATANTGIAIVDGYSPRRRREMEANVFASEFFLPLPLAREMFLGQQLSASSIAERLGLTIGHVNAQLSESILSGSDRLPETVSSPTPQLDQSQIVAAHASYGPVLVGAGPGTGKTTCLVERCRFLIRDRGVSPQQILLLTFSRKAAQEMRDRIGAARIADGEASPWIGTFHSFGLEILRRFGDRLGLKSDFAVLTPDDCETLLENEIVRLQLKSLTDPEEPAKHIRAIRSEISRVKGEGVDCERYAALAEEAGENDRPKLLEIAAVYEVYQSLLRENDAVDLDDLIVLTVDLLERYDDVRSIVKTDFPQILADEYQDVNAASAKLLKLLAGPEAAGLWVVGDEYQTIYRFRGASPANIERFRHDFPLGHRFELAHNYRSVPGIVELAVEYARQLDSDSPPVWNAIRSARSGSPIQWAAANSEVALFDGIAKTIREIPFDNYGEFAVLCRSHKKASLIAEQLMVRGVPALHLGDILEYDEVKDLLTLMAPAAQTVPFAALRAGAVYGISHEELLATISRSDVNQDERSAKLRLYYEHMELLSALGKSPAALLDAILWDITRYGLQLAANGDPNRIDIRIAVSTLRDLAVGYEAKKIRPTGAPENPIAAFIAYLEQQRRTSGGIRGHEPDSLDSADFVRVTTIHASKGLEFKNVIIPYLQVRQFPPSARHSSLPSLPLRPGAESDGLDEERCLLFVALTRARNSVLFTRVAKQESGRNISISPLLTPIKPWLIEHTGPEETWTTTPPVAADPEAQQVSSECEIDMDLKVLDSADAEEYTICPRRYAYRRMLDSYGPIDAEGTVRKTYEPKPGDHCRRCQFWLICPV